MVYQKHQQINHCPKTLSIDIQKHPTIPFPRQYLVPPPAEESLQPRPLDLDQGVTGYGHHDPPPSLYPVSPIR